MIVTIHQPEHIPWLGFFNKAMNCDCFVILDNVQYRKNYFQNRNQIISSSGEAPMWLSIPVKKGKLSNLISEKEMIFDLTERKNYFKKIEHSYKKYPFYEKYIIELKDIFNNNNKLLSKLNIELIRYFFSLLEIKCDLVTSSNFSLDKKSKGGLITFDICNFLGAKTYLSGISGKDYLDLTPFKKHNINVIFQEFKHPIYNQPNKKFVSHLSILDLLFSHEIDDIIKIIISSYKL